MVQTLILILNYSNKHILLVYGDQARAYPQTWIKYFFDMTGFFEGQNLTQKHCDSRQNVNGNQSKKQSFKGYL